MVAPAGQEGSGGGCTRGAAAATRKKIERLLIPC
jgi:hypothetical protein